MGKHLGLILALCLGLIPAGASALTLQTLAAPDGGPQFADPDEKRPFAPYSQREGEGSSAPREGDSGFHFSVSGGNRDNPMFMPGYTVPAQHGPLVDPQTHDPYPR